MKPLPYSTTTSWTRTRRSKKLEQPSVNISVASWPHKHTHTLLNIKSLLALYYTIYPLHIIFFLAVFVASFLLDYNDLSPLVCCLNSGHVMRWNFLYYGVAFFFSSYAKVRLYGFRTSTTFPRCPCRKCGFYYYIYYSCLY